MRVIAAAAVFLFLAARRDGVCGGIKLVKIEMVPHGDGQPILCSHSMAQAFELAEGFAKALHHRVKAGGFIKTLLQRRVGSSLVAGLKTTDKMLAGKQPSGCPA